MNCEVCNNKETHLVLDLGYQPLSDELINNNRSKELFFQTNIYYCKLCYTAHQKIQVPKKILFKKNYHYRSKNTIDVLYGMENLVNSIKKIFSNNLKNKKILDVGCNDGSLLNFFKKNGSITYGVEPSDACKDASANHKIYQKYFDLNFAKFFKKKHGKLDIITFTNVFAHIEDLKLLLKAIDYLCSEKTVICIENHYLGSVIKTIQFDTFYHEHLRTYSLNSFKYISKILSTKIIHCSFPKRYGGNIRIFFQKQPDHYNNDSKLDLIINSKEINFYNKLKGINFLIKKWKKNKLLEIKKLNKKFGPLPAKAFPARASILINLLKLTKKNIFAVYEKPQSKKIGFFVPGTNIPIVSDKDLFKIKKIIPVINLAWHIPSEIKKYLKNKGINNKIINIIKKSDFY